VNITDTCAECRKIVIKLPRFGCRVCFDATGKEGETFCSEKCVETHKGKKHKQGIKNESV
jgi:predicted nucleic acid-binding Zn ribbon protein